MAKPYPAGGVSIAQSNPTCCGPAAPGPGAPGPFSKTAGLPSPNVPGAILIVSDSTLNGLRAR